MFGSCRVAVPHEEPWNLSRDEDERGREVDALYALALRMMENDRSEWPHLLLSVGDQVYVDEDAPATREFIRARRDVSLPPGEEVADFEEYTHLYKESWGPDVIRWLFSTVGVAMIFDDHDVHDDWNTSIAWVEEMRAKPWWEERIESALSSYWIYQHLGNLSPAALADDELLEQVKEAGDAGPAAARLRQARRSRATRAAAGASAATSAGCGSACSTRARAARSASGRARSSTTRSGSGSPSTPTATSTTTSSPTPFRSCSCPALHHVEAWNEAVCAGAWGEWAAGIGERIRRALDLEHWAAFNESFRRMVRLIGEIGSGRRGKPPATIIAIGGDVHHAYLAEVAYPPGAGVQSAVYQAVCSPFRNALNAKERAVVRNAARRGAEPLTRLLARAAGVPDPEVSWRLAESPTFDNQFATLELDGRSAVFRIERTERDEADNRSITTSLERRLA